MHFQECFWSRSSKLADTPARLLNIVLSTGKAIFWPDLCVCRVWRYFNFYVLLYQCCRSFCLLRIMGKCNSCFVFSYKELRLWDAPAGSHSSRTHHLGLDIFLWRIQLPSFSINTSHRGNRPFTVRLLLFIFGFLLYDWENYFIWIG